MTSGKIQLSKKENDRVRVLVRAAESGRTNKEVALALSLCVRQVQRLKKALKEEGPAGKRAQTCRRMQPGGGRQGVGGDDC